MVNDLYKDNDKFDKIYILSKHDLIIFVIIVRYYFIY